MHSAFSMRLSEWCSRATAVGVGPIRVDFTVNPRPLGRDLERVENLEGD